MKILKSNVWLLGQSFDTNLMVYNLHRVRCPCRCNFNFLNYLWNSKQEVKIHLFLPILLFFISQNLPVTLKNSFRVSLFSYLIYNNSDGDSWYLLLLYAGHETKHITWTHLKLLVALCGPGTAIISILQMKDICPRFMPNKWQSQV